MRMEQQFKKDCISKVSQSAKIENSGSGFTYATFFLVFQDPKNDHKTA